MYASSYCVTNRRHSNKRSCPDSGASDDEIFEFSRWFVVQPADENTSLNSLSAFALGKALKAQIGTLLTVRRLQRGDILIETDNPMYASMLQKMDSLAHVPVKVTPHRTLNSSKGVVRSRELASCDVAEILTELKPQGVTDAVIISVRDGSDDKRRKTNTVILTFNRAQPPSHITAGYMRVLLLSTYQTLCAVSIARGMAMAKPTANANRPVAGAVRQAMTNNTVNNGYIA